MINMAASNSYFAAVLACVRARESAILRPCDDVDDDDDDDDDDDCSQIMFQIPGTQY